jgi:Trp operon repressor
LKGQIQGDTISITVPKVLVGSPFTGAPFHTVTGYALSERAPLLPAGADLPNAPAPAPKTTSVVGDPTSLPVLLDASGAATYTAGDGGPREGGAVEVSLDDPGFASPRAASTGADPGAGRWQLQLSASELAPGAHTAYVRQRINGRAASSAVSLAFTVSDKVERDVTALVTLDARNPVTLAGSVSYDLLLKNASAQTIYTPMAARVSKLTSGSNGVTAANADNGQTGAGASFDYGNVVGGDGALSPNETTSARRLRFNNPSNEPFTVEFQIVGQLPRGVGGTTVTTTTSGGSTSSNGGTGSAGTNSTSGSASALVSAVLRVTYNPLLGTATVERLK